MKLYCGRCGNAMRVLFEEDGFGEGGDTTYKHVAICEHCNEEINKLQTERATPQKKKNSPAGVVALILCAFGWIGLLSIVGVILGCIDVATDKEWERSHSASMWAFIFAMIYFTIMICEYF